jgi:hypothetical protein
LPSAGTAAGKHYAIAAVVALAGIALTTMTFFIGLREQRGARRAEPVLAELQQRVAGRLQLHSGLITVTPAIGLGGLAPVIAFGLALLLNVASLLYAVIH